MNTLIEAWLNNETRQAIHAARSLSYEAIREAMINDGFGVNTATDAARFLKNLPPITREPKK